jgi:small-conductance mechanosensitive channel
MQELLHQWLHEFWVYLPKLIGAIAFLIIGWYIIGRTLRILEATMLRRALDPNLSTFFKSFANIGLKVFVLITAAGLAGFEITSLVTLLGAAGLAIGLSLQGELQNFAGGVMILLFKPFKVDDYIKVGNSIGRVKEIQILNTQLVTEKGEAIIIPNRNLTNEVIVNYSNLSVIRLELQLTIPQSEFKNTDIENICLDLMRTLHGNTEAANPEFLVINCDDIAQTVTFEFSFDVDRKQHDELRSAWWKHWLKNKV